MMAAMYPPASSRRQYPRVQAGDPSRYSPKDEFSTFCARTAPTLAETKEDIFDKSAADPFRHDNLYGSGHISLAAPEAKLDLTFKDGRARATSNTMRPQLDVLERPLRCMTKGPGPSDALGCDGSGYFDGQPQPVPAATQKQETELVDAIEKALQNGATQVEQWDQYANRAEKLLITMSLEKLLRVLKAFVSVRYRKPEIYTLIGSELAKEVKTASSTRLVQTLHWIARAGLRDQTLMTLIGNEMLIRLNDDFVVDMYLEVLNVHAKLDIRNPRLVGAILREMAPTFEELSRDQCAAVAPLTVMNVLSDQARVAYLSRCAALGLGIPARMTKPSVLRQLRLLEDCLRFDYHPTTLPNDVQVWLTNLKAEADAQDQVEATPLSAIEGDILRILREEMDIAVEPVLQDGIFSVHLVAGKTAIEVLDPLEDYYITPAMGGQKLLRADTKLRQRLLWRRGWRLITLEEEDWRKLTDDLFKKDLLEEILSDTKRHSKRMA